MTAEREMQGRLVFILSDTFFLAGVEAVYPLAMLPPSVFLPAQSVLVHGIMMPCGRETWRS